MKKVLGFRFQVPMSALRLTLTLALALTLSLQIVAQTTIKGTVIDSRTGEALSYVNVKVTKSGETKMLKGGLTDSEGNFVINGMSSGTYQVQLSFVGYNTITKGIKAQSGKRVINMGRIKMSDDGKMLKEVTVTGQRSAIKLEVDRKSYDVSQDIANVGASASEALENIPSVEVDQDGNISLRGSTSVEVWINGKASGLNSDNRGTILQQIPAESIERIEVIDNPSAKYSAEGSTGIINIIMKRDRKAGFYGSVQGGGDTFGGANANANINFNSKWVDAYASVGYRHMDDKSENLSNQDLLRDGVKYGFQNNDTKSEHTGNMLFTRAGVTVHATDKDDFTLSGMYMYGKHNDNGDAPYYYGTYQGDAAVTDSTMTRYTTGNDRMEMKNIDFDYRHNFSDTHFIELDVNHDEWSNKGNNTYQDRTVDASGAVIKESWQHYPQNINNKSTEIKLDYENKFSDAFLLQAGYNGRFNRENTPQEAETANNFEGKNRVVDKAYYNRFVYDIDIHALYATGTLKFGKFGIMGGLRGEYWKVNTLSYTYDQDHPTPSTETTSPTPYKKNFFQLFPSVFATYQLTKDDQLQLSWTRRLQRPWGGQMNSFMDTRSATNVSFGNPQLTPEYSNNYALNYLRTWENHSLLVSAFYNKKTDVIQQVRYRVDGDSRTFQTNMNATSRMQSGLELTAKNKLWRILDITTSAQFYYNKLDGFDIMQSDPLYGKDPVHVNPTVHISGDAQSQFSWQARTQISVMLPWDMSVQVKANYRSRQVIVQGERPARYGIDLGMRKSFFNKKLTVALNCRDLLDSRARITETWSDSFYQYSKNRHHARKFNITLTWAFGSNNSKKKPKMDQGGNVDASTNYSGEESGGEE